MLNCTFRFVCKAAFGLQMMFTCLYKYDFHADAVFCARLRLCRVDVHDDSIYSRKTFGV
ncbi:hypothetical protein [Choristoneura diversana nucleopolyhedrovirus]|nr:hypothetical protein [Choristoneura diversana nucleopolyhedrovirus]